MNKQSLGPIERAELGLLKHAWELKNAGMKHDATFC